MPNSHPTTAEGFASQAGFPVSVGNLQTFELRRQEACYTGRFASLGADAYALLKEYAANILHPEELAYFKPLPAERRRISYLLGRYAAKRALLPGLGNPAFADIRIAPGIFQNPVVCFPMSDPWQVSITHSEAMVCAVAFPAVHPMALDIESIDPERVATMASQCVASELAEAAQLGLEAPSAATLLWTAKEALSKTLHTGLTCPFALFEIQSLDRIGDFEYRGLYKNLAQYRFHSWICGDSVLTITLPKRTEIVFELGRPCLPASGPRQGTETQNSAGGIG